MAKSLYYRLSPYDARAGHGYGTTVVKGSGRTWKMGSNETGIYTREGRPLEDAKEDENDVDAYVEDVLSKKFKNKTSSGPSGPIDRITRYDASSYVMNHPLPEGNFPKARTGISPFSSKFLYPGGPSKHLGGSNTGGFDGLPMFTGAASQAFNTTGPYRRTGTVHGFSHAPDPIINDDEIRIFNLEDMEDIDIDELNLLRQTKNIERVLKTIKEIEQRV